MADAVLGTFAVVLLAAASTASACALRIRGRAAFAAAGLVLAGAIIVLGTIVLSAAHELTQGGFLVWEVAAWVAAAAWWTRSGRASPPGRWWPPAFRHVVPGDLVVTLVVVLASVALLVQALLAVAVAPSNWDSMAYHLSRVGYWLQNHHAGWFPGGTVRQLTSPPNGEALQGWTLAVTGTDRFAGLVQWIALVGIACCTYLGARMLRFTGSAALFAACLFVILPIPVLEGATTQNDLVTGFSVVASVVFGARGLRDRDRGDVAVAALALGLALGTKGTAIALLPSIALVLGAVAYAHRPPARFLVGSAAAAVLAVVLFGSWGYVENLRHTGTPFGDLVGRTQRVSPIAQNTVRTLWAFVETPGANVPAVNTAVVDAARSVIRPDPEAVNVFAYTVDVGVSEDVSGYGIFGWLFLFPLLVVALFQCPERRVLAAAVLLGVAAFDVAFESNAWVGRLLIPTIALSAPLFAILARYRVLALAAIAAASVSLVPALLWNPNRQLLAHGGRPSALPADRMVQLTLAQPAILPVMRDVEKRVGPRAPIAFVGGEDAWDYPLFGAHRERRVVRFTNPAEVTPATLRRLHLRAALFAGVPVTPGLRAHATIPGYSLAFAPRQRP